MKFFLKYIVIKTLRVTLELFRVFDVKNRIIYFAIPNYNYICNPKYIAEYLRSKNIAIEHIWVTKNNNNNLPNDLKQVKLYSFKYFYYLMTSKIIINNAALIPYLPVRKEVYSIYTWHGGGAYKKVELDMPIAENIWYKKRTLIGIPNVSFYLSSSKEFTEIQSHATHIPKNKFISTGMPRNDLFFCSDKIVKSIKKVKEKYKLSNDEKIILYAPTWRDDSREIIIKLNNMNVIKAFEKITNSKVKLLIRAHYNTKQDNFQNNFINATMYPDMQELLCAADILITDYSSCMWDFSLMYKPCFIYATDIDQYKQERDFYTPMSEWPFPIATNTDELIHNIVNFNEREYVEKVKKHHQALGSYEDGHACERVCKLIEDIIDGKV